MRRKDLAEGMRVAVKTTNGYSEALVVGFGWGNSIYGPANGMVGHDGVAVAQRLVFTHDREGSPWLPRVVRLGQILGPYEEVVARDKQEREEALKRQRERDSAEKIEMDRAKRIRDALCKVETPTGSDLVCEGRRIGMSLAYAERLLLIIQNRHG